MCSSFAQKQVTSMHKDKRKCKRLTYRTKQVRFWETKEPGQHGNGENQATHEESCLRPSKGESVPADAHQRKSALA